MVPFARGAENIDEELRHSPEPLFFESFRAAQKRRRVTELGNDLRQHLAHDMRRQSANDQVLVFNRLVNRSSRANVCRENNTGEIGPVFAIFGYLPKAIVAVAPQGNMLTFIGEHLRQRGTPTARDRKSVV